MSQQINTSGLSALIFIILAAVALSTGMYTVDSGSVGVLSTFGRYSDQVKEPGLHFKIPAVQDITIIDTKMQTAHYQQSGELGVKDGVIRKPKIIVLDSKNLSIGMEITVQFSPTGERAREILVLYGQNYFEKLINPIIRDVVRDVVSQYQAEEIAVKRSAISSELNASLGAKFNKLPFTLHELQLRHIDLPQIVRKKIEEVQLAKQEEQRLVMIEKQAEKNQHIKTIEANTRLIELTTQAKAEAEKKKIQADAKAYQITREAEALSEANRALGASLSKDLISYEAMRRWDGAYPKFLMGEKQGLMVKLPQFSEIQE